MKVYLLVQLLLFHTSRLSRYSKGSRGNSLSRKQSIRGSVVTRQRREIIREMISRRRCLLLRPRRIHPTLDMLNQT